MAVRRLPKDVLKMASGLISPSGLAGHRGQLCIVCCGIVGNDSIYGAVIVLLNSPTKFMNAPYIRAPRFSAVFACLELPRDDSRQLMQQRRFLAQ